MQETFTQEDKIPIIVGVTGHRKLLPEDIPRLKEEVKAALLEIGAMCKNTPVVMLNAFAEGADTLCAEVAIELGIKIYALLPCPAERYQESFEDPAAKARLPKLLESAERVIIAPDVEVNKPWLQNAVQIKDADYEYRQLGIYMASNCHILLALWDGGEPHTNFGCGTAEVVRYALEQNYLSREHLVRPGCINDSAVLWISTASANAAPAQGKRKWLASKYAFAKGEREKVGKPWGDYLMSEAPTGYVCDIIAKTDEYNASLPEADPDAVKLWGNVEELDGYRRALRRHYIKADALSYSVNQKKYNAFLLLIACLGTLVALFFMLYDDAQQIYMIYLCAAALCALLAVTGYGKRKKVHERYVGYRAFAEALRIQFYATMCVNAAESEDTVGGDGQSEYHECICELYSWTQKSDMVWVSKALRTFDILYPSEKLLIPSDRVMQTWIGEQEEKPRGQLAYHSDRVEKNKARAKLYRTISSGIKILSVAIYAVVFCLELATCFVHAGGGTWFWEGDMAGGLAWRSLGVIVIGTATAASLLFSSYLGKLSYDRKASDNRKMMALYASAWARWKDIRNKHRPVDEVRKFVREVAREELVENGIWCSYIIDNGLEVAL